MLTLTVPHRSQTVRGRCGWCVGAWFIWNVLQLDDAGWHFSLGAFVLSQFTRLTDRRTDRRSSERLRCIQCSAVKSISVNTSSYCFSVNAQLYRECKVFSYTRTLQGLELKVCGLGLGLKSFCKVSDSDSDAKDSDSDWNPEDLDLVDSTTSLDKGQLEKV